MKKLMLLTLAAVSIAAVITANKSFFKVILIDDKNIIVRDSNGKLQQWKIHKKTTAHYVLKQGHRAVLLSRDVREGYRVKLYSIF